MCLLTRFGSSIAAVLILAACSSGSSSGGSSPLANACASHNGQSINREAIALSSSNSPDNACMELHQYNLFEPNETEGFLRGDPRRPLVVDGEHQGLPYVLNTALFSDYTAKHRIVFLPKDENGDFIPAEYRDADSNPDGTPGTGKLGKANDNFIFPVGTVIAKSFTYPDTSLTGGPVERVIETRLLIKHTNTSDGSERWEGVTYVWTQDDATDEWIARRQNSSNGAGTFDEARSWHYPDPNDPDQIIEGSNAEGENPYSLPSRDNCITCHRNSDQDAGAAPIGLKARFLNRPYISEYGEFAAAPAELEAGDSVNQIEFWITRGWLVEGPEETADADGILTGTERIQPYNVPGDDNAPEADLAARARGYLEVNCAHCHNQLRGVTSEGIPAAGVEDFYMEFQRQFCWANLFGQGNIEAGDAEDSTLYRRISGNEGGNTPMPPLARQMVHEEGVEMIAAWINNMPTDICADP